MVQRLIQQVAQQAALEGLSDFLKSLTPEEKAGFQADLMHVSQPDRFFPGGFVLTVSLASKNQGRQYAERLAEAVAQQFSPEAVRQRFEQTLQGKTPSGYSERALSDLIRFTHSQLQADLDGRNHKYLGVIRGGVGLVLSNLPFPKSELDSEKQDVVNRLSNAYAFEQEQETRNLAMRAKELLERHLPQGRVRLHEL